MAPKESKESLEWSKWKWNENRQLWRSQKKDRKGVVKDTRWAKSLNKTEQQDTSQEGQHEDTPASNYSHTGSDAGYQAPAATSPPRTSNVLTDSASSSGLPTAPGTAQLGNIIYQTSSYKYPAGWDRPPSTTGQFSQVPYPPSLYSSHNYTEQGQLLSYSDPQPSQRSLSSLPMGGGHSRGQDAAVYNSIPAPSSYYQTGSNWHSEFRDTIRRDSAVPSEFMQQNNPLVDNKLATEYRDENTASGQQSANSGFGSEYLSPKWISTSQNKSQPQHLSQSTVPTGPRKSGSKENPTPEGDEIDKMIQDIVDTSLVEPNMGTAVLRSQRYSLSQYHNSEDVPESGSNIPHSEHKNNFGDEGTGHVIKPSGRGRSNRKNSAVYFGEAHQTTMLQKSRDLQKHRDDSDRVMLQTASTSLRSKTSSYKGDPAVYHRPALSTSPRQQSPIMEQQVLRDTSEKASSYAIDSVDNIEKPETNSRRSHRRTSEVQQPKERPKDLSKSDLPRQDQIEREQQIPASLEPRKRDKRYGNRHHTKPSYDNTRTQFDPNFKVHKSKYFEKGAVLKILWSEPLGDKNPKNWEEVPTEGNHGMIRNAKYGEKAYDSVRRFAIVKSQDGHSLCLPILTYQYQGTTKPGVKPEVHAVIYTGDRPPALLEGETELGKRPIRVDTSSHDNEALFVESRINYSKVYTVEHNIKVWFIGKIHEQSMARFLTDWSNTLAAE